LLLPCFRFARRNANPAKGVNASGRNIHGTRCAGQIKKTWQTMVVVTADINSQ